MFHMSESAAEHLARMLDEVKAPAGSAARFIAQSDGVGVEVDNPRPGDQTFEFRGRTVLLLDTQIAALLDDHQLAVQQSELGPMLAID